MSSQGSASMNGDCYDSEEKEPPRDSMKRVEDENVGEGNELKVYEDINIRGKTGQGSLQPNHLQKQSQGTPFYWERFLHIRTIKVLLVENDDCTRHVVAALLRNCNYEVIEVSNGLQAWKVLENLTNHVDLILSEVVMPCVSGIGLLCKIMTHKSRKNIPVIMMSSHDSMGLVFNCLSKGAVDFLVKPIRKNELKNLWQHFWRRCHSSSGSGSGSESCSQTQKSINSKRSEKLENHSVSSDKEDDGSNGLNNGDGSDSQSSCTKQPAEVDSSQEAYPVDQEAECEDSTCAQVIYSNAEAVAIKQLQETGAGNRQQLLQPGTKSHGLVAGETVKLERKPDAIDSASNHIVTQANIPLEINPYMNGNMEAKILECPTVDYQSNNHQVVCTTISDPDVEFNRSGASLEHTDRVVKMNNIPKNYEKPTVELCSKRLRDVHEMGNNVQDDYNILGHSELSAFSRYNEFTAFRTPDCIAITRSSSVINKSLDGGKKELYFDIHCHSYDDHLYPSSKRGSNTVVIDSNTNKLLSSPLLFLSEATSTMNGLHPSCAFNPVKDDVRCNTQQVNGVKQSDLQFSTFLAPARGSHPYHVNNFHNSDQQMSNNEDLSLRKLAADAPYCGSSNVPGVPGKANPLNCSLERSASACNYGSNGHIGSSNAVNTCGTNGECDTGINLQSGSGYGSGSGSGSGNTIDQKRLPQRETALAKFRRKERRCFENRVRHQNKKLLAEMRPCGGGQFVRQIEQDDSSSNEADEH